MFCATLSVVKSQTEFSSELPDDILLRLPTFPKAAAAAINHFLDTSQKILNKRKVQFLTNFKNSNQGLLQRLKKVDKMLMGVEGKTTGNHPLITIIIAVLNNVKMLDCCLESVCLQNYSAKELIVIDGGSNDGSLEIIEKYSDYITYWESKPDRGIYHAWNKGVRRANGDWIGFLGADDFLWDKKALSNILPYLDRARHEGIKAVYGRVVKLDKAGNTVRIEGKAWDKIGWLMRHGMPVPHPGLLHHRDFFKEHGLFDESFRIAGDYDLLLRELKDHQALFAEKVTTVGCLVGGIADSNAILTQQEVFRARKKQHLPFSLIWLSVYIRSYIRRFFVNARKKIFHLNKITKS